MPVARPESSDSRVIGHVDMDCFYVQVEQRKQPELKGLPTAVVQYNEWKGGALIAVSYEARKFGVKRSMRGEEAKEVCPQINLVQVPVSRGKADLNAYRSAGSEVVSILSRKGKCERASIDEVYLDLTDAAQTMLAETPPETLEAISEEVLKSHILGQNEEDENYLEENVRKWMCRKDADHRDKLLACGMIIVAELRLQVLSETQFTCSAGIAHNKMLAKLASGMNKPAQQTVVPFSSVEGLLASLPVRKMKQLGGKLGYSLQIDLGVNTVGDLLQFSEEKLQEHYGINTGSWLWNIARGISGEEVEERLLPKSHGSGKSFPGPRALKTIFLVQHWLNKLCEELNERLCMDMEQNKRIAHTLSLHASAYKSSDSDSHRKFPSKSCPLRYGTAKIQEDAFNLFQAGLRDYIGACGVKTQGTHCNGWAITALSVSASKIVPIPSGTRSIDKYFNGQSTLQSSLKEPPDNLIQEVAQSLPSGSESCFEVNLTEEKNESHEDKSGIKDAVPDPRQEGSKITTLKLQASEDLPCFLQQADDPIAEASELVSSGSERVLELNKGGKKMFPASVQGIMIKPNDRKKRLNGTGEKGASSILELFKAYSHSGSSLSQQENGAVQGEASQCRGDGHAEVAGEVEVGNEGKSWEHGINSGSCSSERNERNNQAWRSYKMDEIDPSVISELPPEIQDEFQAWLRPIKRPNAVKRSSTISHYFQPTKSSQGNPG